MILNTYILTYLLLSFLSLAVGLAAIVHGLCVARKWRPERSSEEQYALEKKVYLSITLVTLGFYMRLMLVPLWFLTLQSLVPSIPGAMCLCGVHLAKTPYAFIATTLKFILPMAYGYWLALNALDRSIESQPLMRRKLYTLIPLGLLMVAESFFDLTFLFSVKPRVVECCSSIFDDPAQRFLQTMTYSGWGWVIVFFAAGFVLLALATFLLRRVRSRAGILLWMLGPLTLIAFVLAIHTRLSPMFLYAQFHHCIFCVWQKLPDMIVTTLAVCVSCWASLIYAATRGVYKHPDAAISADAYAKLLLKWAIGAGLVGYAILTVRLVVELLPSGH